LTAILRKRGRKPSVLLQESLEKSRSKLGTGKGKKPLKRLGFSPFREFMMFPVLGFSSALCPGKLKSEETPPTVKPAFSLEQLLEGVPEENLHREVEPGPAPGNEVW